MARKKKANTETDSHFFLKMVLYLILGCLWIRIDNYPDWVFPVPLGFFLGIIFARHDSFQIDRKIEFVLLLIASFVAFWLPIGIYVYV